MHRLSAAKACFLSESTEDMPKPDDQKIPPSTTLKNGTNRRYEVVSELTDRSDLSDEMASLCAKLPIYRVKKTTSPRVKRQLFCTKTYYYKQYYPCGNYLCYRWKSYRVFVPC